MAISTIKWINNSVRIIDQCKLPVKLEYISCRDLPTLWHAIRNLSVRGAPALGVAAAFGVLLGLKKFKGDDRKKFAEHLKTVCDYIGTSRPTAVNLFHALSEMKNVAAAHPAASVNRLKRLFKQKAFEIFEEDRRTCRQMGVHGAKLIRSGVNVLTVCNAGALATVDYGTALGVLYTAKSQGKKFKVYSCETRPLLQGSRLTAWELSKEKIDTTLICDNMAATLMKQKKIDMVFAGADRIAQNGDTANKIGTYNLAVLARYHQIPFYIVAPFSTSDGKIKKGSEIPIEERDPREVVQIGNQRLAPKNIKVYNPAFDVTDNHLITAIVTELGIISPPFPTSIPRMFAKYNGQRGK